MKFKRNNKEKTLRFSIRKYHVGAVSVAVSTMLFIGSGAVYAKDNGIPSSELANEHLSENNKPKNSLSANDRSNIEHTNLENTETNKPNAVIHTSNIADTNNGSASSATGTIENSSNSGSSETTPNPEPSRARRSKRDTPANYDGKVSLIGQWTSESHEKKDTENTYKNATDKLGSPLPNPGLFRGAAKTFLGWSDKPPVDGKIAEGARLFSPEDTLATAFPDGLKSDSKLYGVYASLNDQDEPFPTDKFSMGFAIIGGMNKFKINDNKVNIDTNVKSDDVLPNTKLNKDTEDKEKNTRRIIDEYKPDNNDTTKVNEVVLKAEFEMDKTTAMTVYRNPHIGYVGPVLSNSYKGNQFELGERRKTYTYVDLNVNLDKDLVVPEKLYAEFNGYSWRPLYALGIKEDGTKELLHVYSKNGTDLGNSKDSFNSIVSNTDPRVTFGVETKGNHNITFRMILRSLSDKDSDRPENERNERIAENVVKPDAGKSIAETIMRNMTLRSLTSTELKALFPNKSDEEINQMVIRINQEKAKGLADTNGETVLRVTGSVEGNVHPNAGKIGWFNSATNLPINKVEANVLELGYVTFYNVSYRFQSGTPGKTLPEAIEGYKPTDQNHYENQAEINATQPTSTEYADAENDGKWVFKGYDEAKKQVNKADVEFIGTWVFEANKYGVTYRFQSGTEGKMLPAAIEGYKPTDQNRYADKANVAATQPTTKEYVDTVNDGKWVFKSYDAESKVVNKADVEFIGKWEFEANKYGVTYRFQSGTPDKILPQAIEGYKPTDQNRYADKANVAATQPTTKEYVDTVNDGKWVFKSYDAESKVVNKADVEFIGKWEFEANKYGVTYRFESGTEGKELPKNITELTPIDKNEYINGKEVKAESPAKTDVKDGKGSWVFKGYKEDKKIINKENVQFLGLWEYVEKEPEPKPEPKPELKPEPESKPEPKPEPKREPESKPEPKSKPELELEQKTEQPATSVETSISVSKQELPNTGTEELSTFTPAVLAILIGLGLATPTVVKKKDEE